MINLPFLGTQRFSDFEELSFIWLRLDLFFDKLGLCETFLDHRVVDLLLSTPDGLQNVKQCELKRLSLGRSIEPAFQYNLLKVSLEVLYDSLIQWLRIDCCVCW